MDRPVVNALTPLSSARSLASQKSSYGAALQTSGNPFDHVGQNAPSQLHKVPPVKIRKDGDFAANIKKDAATWFLLADKNETGWIQLSDVLTAARQLFYNYGLPAPDQDVIERSFRSYSRLQEFGAVMIDQPRFIELSLELAGCEDP
jgi:hypothetical protein